MALTDLQRRICRLLAANRIASGESYVAGGQTVAVLPPGEAGTCALDVQGGLLRATPATLPTDLRDGRAHFHRGRLRGAMPRLVTLD